MLWRENSKTDQDIKHLYMNRGKKNTLGECHADALRDSEAVTQLNTTSCER